MSITTISAVTFAVNEMAPALEFYEKLGFTRIFGGPDADFSTLQAGEAFVNLIHKPGYEGEWWGRTIFRVENADVQYAAARSAGFEIDPPRDAPWGERYFHITDPDGHELSFAEITVGQS
jgi:catechol 2,3-dioxygenase-like lactoylglutathione lyase family enzyme